MSEHFNSLFLLFKFIRSEAGIYLKIDKPKLFSVIELIILDSGFQLYFFYLVSRYFHIKWGKKPILWLVPKIVKQIGRILTGSSIHQAAEIGKGFMIAYGIGIVIGSHVKIGENVAIFSGISIGSAMPGKAEIKQPEIGNNVLIGTGAKVLGDIKIGDNVVIGANSVVLSSFDSNVTVAGIPAKVVKVNK